MTKKSTLSVGGIPTLLKQKMKLLVVAAALVSAGAQAQITVTLTTPATSSWAVPSGVTSMKVECWGGGGAGGTALSVPNATSSSYRANVIGGGGAGGSYAAITITNPTAGDYTYTVGKGASFVALGTAPDYFPNLAVSNGGNTSFNNLVPEIIVKAVGGAGGESVKSDAGTLTAGLGGAKATTGNIGTISAYGGAGAAAITDKSGAGGGSAGAGDGPTFDGGNAVDNTGGAAGTNGGVVGATGSSGGVGEAGGGSGAAPGAGGSGARDRAMVSTAKVSRNGGNGGDGRIIITLNGYTTVANGETLTIPSGGTLTIPSGTTLTIASGGTLTIASGGTLTVAAGGKITNEGTITNAGTINYLSDATNGTATYLGAGTISGAGTVKVNQSLQHQAGALRSWYVSSPSSVATITPSPALSVIKSFNEASNDPTPANNWVTSTTMAPKVGYMVTPALATNNLLFTGALNNGDQSISITRRTGTDNKPGFNLIGNPYLSYLDWSAVCAYTDGTTLNSDLMPTTTMWYRTKASGSWGFVTVNGAGVTSPTGVVTKYIPPMQAFWVRALNVGTSTLKLNNTMRFHTDAVNNPSPNLLKAPAAKNTEMTLVRLQVSNGVNTDEAVIYVSENAQNGYDKLDAPKMSNENVEIPEIYTTLGTEKIVINSMNSISMDLPIGLGFIAGSASSFSIKANEISNIPQGVKLILKDNVSNTETDLTDGTATYSFAPATTNTDRFSVIFRLAGNATGINDAVLPTAKVFVNGNNQIVINTLEKSNYVIYNAVGLKVSEGTTHATLLTPRFAAGMYVVKINALSTKVIIK